MIDNLVNTSAKWLKNLISLAKGRNRKLLGNRIDYEFENGTSRGCEPLRRTLEIFSTLGTRSNSTYTLPLPRFLPSFTPFARANLEEGGEHCCVEIVRNYDNSWAGLAELMKTLVEGGGSENETKGSGGEGSSANRDKY